MDSKYEKLPGIAHNEPDCYETPDVVVVSATTTTTTSDNNNDLESNSIQKIDVTTKQAFDKFNNQQVELNSRFVDFSDSISKFYSAGYLIGGSGSGGQFETPFAKYNRLLREINDLKAELSSQEALETTTTTTDEVANKNKEINENGDGDDVNFLFKEVEKLQKHAATLHLDTLKSSLNIDKKTNKNFLVEQINEFKQILKSTGATATTTTTQNGDNSIVYKIFNDADNNNVKNSTKLSDLNQRLTRLESILDSKTNKDLLSTLTANSDNKTILGLVEHLNTRISLIDGQSIEIIESKLQWMIQKLNQLNEKKTALDDNEKYNKINDMYGKLVKWQELFAMFPKLVERLGALNELSQQATQFSTILSRLDGENVTMKQTLEANVDIISQLRTNLDNNLTLIKTNIENLRKFVQVGDDKK